MIITKKTVMLTFCILFAVVLIGSAFAQAIKRDMKLMTCFITPAGGEEWRLWFTSPIKIRWIKGSGKITDWTLILFRANPAERIGFIAKNLPKNRRSYSWRTGTTKTKTAEPGSGYFIRLKYKWYDENRRVDSPKFSITDFKSNIIITSPKQGETYYKDDSLKIDWETQNLSGMVDIFLLDKGPGPPGHPYTLKLRYPAKESPVYFSPPVVSNKLHIVILQNSTKKEGISEKFSVFYK
jgi:hypothetical protein